MGLKAPSFLQLMDRSRFGLMEIDPALQAVPMLYPPQPFSSHPIHYYGTFAIYEEAKRTDGLAGTTFVQTSTAELKGKVSWLCVFSVSLRFQS